MTYILLTLFDKRRHELWTCFEQLQKLLLLLWPWIVLQRLQKLLHSLLLRNIRSHARLDHVRRNVSPRHVRYHLRVAWHVLLHDLLKFQSINIHVLHCSQLSNSPDWLA